MNEVKDTHFYIPAMLRYVAPMLSEILIFAAVFGAAFSGCVAYQQASAVGWSPGFRDGTRIAVIFAVSAISALLAGYLMWVTPATSPW